MSRVVVFTKSMQIKQVNAKCYRCKEDFEIGEEIVSTQTTHRYSSSRHKYHKRCYCDAKGVPLHE
jgi:hypothetical protein